MVSDLSVLFLLGPLCQNTWVKQDALSIRIDIPEQTVDLDQTAAKEVV